MLSVRFDRYLLVHQYQTNNAKEYYLVRINNKSMIRYLAVMGVEYGIDFDLYPYHPYPILVS